MKTRDWSRNIGEQHGQRDRAAAVGTQALEDRERQRHTGSLERWPAIVAVMKTMVSSYNEGAGLEAVTLVEDAANSGVTLESTANGRRGLVIALDGSDVSVRTRNGHGDSMTGMHWVSLDRTAENAAAYLLRNWMEQL